jgi:hypothetical protein
VISLKTRPRPLPIVSRGRRRLRNHPPRLNYGGNGKGRQDDNSAAIDRIDNGLGYVRDNVLICSWRGNRLKNDTSAGELLLLGNFYQRGATANTILHFTSSYNFPTKLFEK